MGLKPIATNRRPMNEWYQNDFYEDMNEFYHPGYRKRIWTAPSVDLRNENTVRISFIVNLIKVSVNISFIVNIYFSLSFRYF